LPICEAKQIAFALNELNHSFNSHFELDFDFDLTPPSRKTFD